MFKARIPILALALGFAPVASGHSQSAPPGEVPVVSVALSSFDFDPKTIHLKAGERVLLRLANTSSGGHDFGAPAFFAAATIDPGDVALIHNGKVELGAHQTVDIALVPRAGTYNLKCDHPFHATLGMKGEIIVDPDK